MGLEIHPSVHRPSIRPEEAHWALSLYPEAGEAGGCLRASGAARPGEWRTQHWRAERAKRRQDEGARRARAKLRRYCAANRLNRLGTLTYAGEGCHDPAALRGDIGEFFRSLRRALGQDRFPYVWVAELHRGGHGLHAHFAVGRYVKQTLIRDVWERGHVHIKLLGDLPVGSGSLAEARLAARYLAKYAGKAFDDGRPAGLHRYEVAQGFQPRKIAIRARTIEGVIDQASYLMRRAPSHQWLSPEKDWDGPPACWLDWA